MRSPFEHLNAAEMHRERVREFYAGAMVIFIACAITFGVAWSFPLIVEHQYEESRE